MPADFYAKAGDDLPAFQAIPRGGDGKSILFSSLPGGTTAAVRFAPFGSTGTAFGGPATLSSTTDPTDSTRACVLVSYTVPVNVVPARYYLEVELDYGNGDSETFPNSDTPATALVSAKLA